MPNARSLVLGFTVLLMACTSQPPITPPATASESNVMMDTLDIPFHKKILANGLTVIVHEDHKTPIVSVTVWYRVGSKDESRGKTGFAHLFEHLMFQGSAHYNDDYFRPLEDVGATDMNGTTGYDVTNYFQTVPSPSLDVALWMESDRMGHLLGVVDQAKLDEQRGVVKNEKRQRESAPYGKAWELIARRTYPASHPYSWTPIGSIEDLDAASLSMVKDWFETYYGAANAVLVISGDIESSVAFAKAEQYFGEIPAGPPVVHMRKWVAPMNAPLRETMHDTVAQARLYKVWNVPEWGSSAQVRLELVSYILGGGKTSRLYRRLIEQEQLATAVTATIEAREIGSQFFVMATAKAGADLNKLEKVIDEELERFLKQGPTPDELDRAKTAQWSAMVRSFEHVGGFDGKAQWLAQGEVFSSRPDAWRDSLRQIERAKVEHLREVAEQWLGNGVYSLTVLPFGEHKTAEIAADRSALPSPGDAPDLRFPTMQKTVLKNGLKVVLAERRNSPLVEIRLILNGGFAADPKSKEGIAALTSAMLDDGTKARSSQQIAEEQERLGAEISARASLDSTTISLSAVSDKLAPSLDLYADIIRHPIFPADEFKVSKQRQLAAIAQEKTQPTSVALRIMPPLLYGEEHPYAKPFSGIGREATVKSLDREDLLAYHQHNFRPDQATLVVVGDVNLSALTPALEKVFGDWRSPHESAPVRQMPVVTRSAQPVVYLINRPGYEQSLILAGQLAPPTGAAEDIPLSAVNAVFGGMFTSRLNMNLREDKHWSYGARSLLPDAIGPRPLLFYAAVQRDKTAAAIKEVLKELRGIRDGRPITASELSRAQKNLTLSLPGEHETAAQVAGSISGVVIYGLSDSYYNTLVSQTRELKLPAVRSVAEQILQPDNLTWVIVGDLDRISKEVRDLNLGPVQVLDVDGRPVDD